MMITKTFLFLLPVVATEAFVVLVPPTTWKATTTTMLGSSSSSSSTPTTTNNNDDPLARLQHEYKVLQEKLLCDVVLKHDEAEAEKIEELMIEKATEATKLQEKKQMEIMAKAERTRLQAERARKRALDLMQEADREAASSSENHAAVVEQEWDAAYDLVLASDFAELEATHKMHAAQILLAQLKENEKILEATLEKLRQDTNKGSSGSLEEEIHTQHRSFLDKVKDAIYAHPDILINLDPHIL